MIPFKNELAVHCSFRNLKGEFWLPYPWSRGNGISPQKPNQVEICNLSLPELKDSVARKGHGESLKVSEQNEAYWYSTVEIFFKLQTINF